MIYTLAGIGLVIIAIPLAFVFVLLVMVAWRYLMAIGGLLILVGVAGIVGHLTLHGGDDPAWASTVAIAGCLLLLFSLPGLITDDD